MKEEALDFRLSGTEYFCVIKANVIVQGARCALDLGGGGWPHWI